jgi:hypothetical protein
MEPSIVLNDQYRVLYWYRYPVGVALAVLSAPRLTQRKPGLAQTHFPPGAFSFAAAQNYLRDTIIFSILRTVGASQ